ncbi:MAG: hypothetical protein P8L44_01145 [Opitutales bacterium]|nr:hypothetical protein [Opitutales bacterium]
MNIIKNPGANPGLKIALKDVIAIVRGDHRKARLSNSSGVNSYRLGIGDTQGKLPCTNDIITDPPIGFSPSYGSHKEDNRGGKEGKRERNIWRNRKKPAPAEKPQFRISDNERELWDKVGRQKTS